MITAAALLNCLTALIFNATEAYGNTSFPVTYQMLELIAGTLYLFLIALITYHAGVLIWEERDSNNDEVQDALPMPEWPAFAAKFVALLSSIAIILAIAMVTAILVQYFHHYHRYQLGLFVATLFGIDFSAFIFLAVLAFFIHVLSPNKYVGYFAFIAFSILNFFVWRPLHVATYLVQFGLAPSMVYSDFFGYAAIPRRLGMVHTVLVSFLRGPGGGDAPAVAARTRPAVEQPAAERAPCASKGRCACSRPWD